MNDPSTRETELQETVKETTQTPPVLKTQVMNLTERLIQEGENVFFRDLPNEVLLLTKRIKVYSFNNI